MLVLRSLFNQTKASDRDSAQPRLTRTHHNAVPWLCWAALCIVVVALLDHERAPSTFFYDEWGFVQWRRGWSFDGFLQPHAGHFVAVPVLIYRTLFELVGLTHYRAFRLVGIASHLAVATAVFAYVKHRTHVVLAGSAATATALLGAGWQNIYFPFSLAQTLPLALGILAWTLVGRADRRGDAGAMTALLVAVMCNGVGVSMLVGTATRFAARREWRRAAVVLAPATTVFAFWYLWYGHSAGSISNVPQVPRYAADMAAGGAGALFGRDLLWGRILLGVLVGAAGSRWRTLGRAAAPLGCLVGTMVLVAYNRVQMGDPTASRYAYVMAVLLLLILADVLTNIRLPRVALPMGIALCTLSVWGNWAVLHRGALGLRIDSSIAGMELRAVEWAKASVDERFEPDHHRMPFNFAGPYLRAVADLGSPAATEQEVLSAPDSTRQLVDQVSVGALAVFAEGDQLPIDVQMQCDTTSGRIELPLAVGQHLRVESITGTVEIRLRRIADTFPADPSYTVSLGRLIDFAIPADNAPSQQWTVQIDAESEFLICK